MSAVDVGNLPRPNTFIIGAPKCGTSSLAFWLSQNPNVCLLDGKESNFWRRDFYKGYDWYIKNHFNHYAGEKIVLDASTINLVLHYSPERIYKLNPNAKIIVCVRNPWERMFSHWRMLKSWRPGRVHNNFVDAISHNLKSFDPDKFSIEGDFVPYLEPKGECYVPSLIEQSLYNYNLSFYEEFFDDIIKVHFDSIASAGSMVYHLICENLGISCKEISCEKFDPNTKTNDVFDDYKYTLPKSIYREIEDIFDEYSKINK